VAPAMRTEVADRCTLDALGLADIGTVDTTNDGWIDKVQQPIQEAALAGLFGQFSLCVVRHAVGDHTDRTVAKTATKPVLPLTHCDCSHTSNIRLPSVRRRRRRYLFGSNS